MGMLFTLSRFIAYIIRSSMLVYSSNHNAIVNSSDVDYTDVEKLIFLFERMELS